MTTYEVEIPTKIRIGQVWQEVDHRHVRHVLVTDANEGQRYVTISTVVRIDGKWKSVRLIVNPKEE